MTASGAPRTPRVVVVPEPAQLRRATAGDLEVSVLLLFLMALTVVGAAALLSPVATRANTMVMEPGGSRFGDCWKLGLPLLLIYLSVAVLWGPVVLAF